MIARRTNGLRALALLSAACLLGPGALADTVVDEATTDVGDHRIQAQFSDLLGAEVSPELAQVFAPEEMLRWEVVVPEAQREAPSGLLVYISPTDTGTIPRTWRRLLDSHNLIWIAANASGNSRPVVQRVAYAVMAVPLLEERYDVDSDRIYLAGFSGGARVAGLAIAAYPHLFDGAVYIGGAEMWQADRPPPDMLRMAQNRFVFLVGSEDGNRAAARQVHSAYAAAGVERLDMMVVRRMGHVLPDARKMHDALEFLNLTNP
ncbi:MAG: hypothetical protein AAF417_15895 [Pseudomonadota bacterium]